MGKVLEITTKIGCKINCKYCPQELLIKRYFDGNPERPAMMCFDTFKTCIDKVPEDVMIDFAGMAEPWLNPECTKMMVYASKKGHKIGVFTTLIGMAEADLDVLESLYAEQLVIHIPDVDGNSKIEVTDDYCRLLRMALNRNLAANPGFSCHGKVHEKIRDLIPKNAIIGDEMIDRAGNLDTIQQHQRILEPCVCALDGRQLQSNILLPDGTVLLCCMDYGMQHVLGNLLTDSYESLFTGDEAARIRSGMENPTSDILCRKCSNALSLMSVTERYLKEQEKASSLWIAQQWMEEQITERDRRISEIYDWTQELEKAKDYLTEQDENKTARVIELEKWNAELEKAKAYLTEQNTNKAERVTELEKWNAELEKAKEYLTEQNTNKAERVTELEKWNAELEKAKAYLAEQDANKTARVTELEKWNAELEKAKAYLTEQDANKTARITELETWNAELEKAKEFLTEQDANKTVRIAELESWCRELEQDKAYLEGLWNQSKAEMAAAKETGAALENRISELENEMAKLQYKLKLLLNDTKIQKIIAKRKYEI